MLTALTRTPSPPLADCQLTYVEREPIDVPRALHQHGALVSLLRSLGVDVHTLPPEPDMPDAVFVEDVAVVLDEIALLCSMGAPSRRPEVDAFARAIAPWRPVERLELPATLEGGDVLKMGRTLYVGLSTRTNRLGADSLRAAVEPLGYSVRAVPVSGCLHLSTGATRLGPGAVLINPQWTDAAAFDGLEVVHTHPDDPWGANSLLVGDTVLLPASSEPTAERLRRRGMTVRTVDISELMKAEAGLTCMVQLFESEPAPPRLSIVTPRRRVVPSA